MGPMCPLPPLSLSLSLQMSLSPASLLYTAGLNRSMERARQTNRHATLCVSGAGAGAGAVSQYAERINAVRRGPPTLTLPDHGAALQVAPGVHSKPDAQRRQESPHLQFHNKSRQLLTGQAGRVGITQMRNT